MKTLSIRQPNPFIPVLMIASGALLMAATLTYSLLKQQPAGSVSAPLPSALAGLPRIEASYGEEALSGISRMHGQDFELISGAIGSYGPREDSPSATVWVSGTDREALAGELVTAMRNRIALGQSPFTSVGERTDGGWTVYELAGMGQQHFYFQSSKLVIWLAVDPGVAESALQDALEFYD